MTPRNPKEIVSKGIPALEKVLDELCSPESYGSMPLQPTHDTPMPSVADLEEMMQRLYAALFPGFFGNSRIHRESMRYHLGANLDSIFRILSEQIYRGSCFACGEPTDDCSGCGTDAPEIALAFMESMPRIRHALAQDVKAAYEGDPAAKSPGETIFCYPSIVAMIHHRIAHELYRLDVPLIPRIISEMAHSRTGIDIHPGASIAEDFFIDHGTGVVIGETCIIGRNVKLYQGVTLGAKSFPLDKDGNPIKGIPRHPIIGDNVIIYANATILGGETVVGARSIIGGNVWLTESVGPDTRVLLEQPRLVYIGATEGVRI